MGNPVMSDINTAADAAQADATAAQEDIDALVEASPFVVDEYTNPAAADAAGLKAATATSTDPVQILAAGLLAPGKAALLDCSRQVVFTTDGLTPSDAPATADIVGTDWSDAAQTETVTLAQTATTATSAKFWKTIVSVDYPAADGTDATIAIGFGAALGLKHKAKTRSAIVNVMKEIAAGSVVTNGVFATATAAPPFGSYAPNSAADGSRDYAVTYEQDLA
jgi:hypothetical protein